MKAQTEKFKEILHRQEQRIEEKFCQQEQQIEQKLGQLVQRIEEFKAKFLSQEQPLQVSLQCGAGGVPTGIDSMSPSRIVIKPTPYDETS